MALVNGQPLALQILRFIRADLGFSRLVLESAGPLAGLIWFPALFEGVLLPTQCTFVCLVLVLRVVGVRRQTVLAVAAESRRLLANPVECLLIDGLWAPKVRKVMSGTYDLSDFEVVG